MRASTAVGAANGPLNGARGPSRLHPRYQWRPTWREQDRNGSGTPQVFLETCRSRHWGSPRLRTTP